MLIDSHAHLDAPYFSDKLPAVLERAQRSGVAAVITIGVTPTSTRNSLEIARQFPGVVFAAAGYHPHWAKGADADRIREAEELAGIPGIVGLGEIGLDYHHFRSTRTDQIRLFRTMLDIAASARLPVIIHDRKAHDDVWRILSEVRSRLSGGIIHCFSGDWNLARRYLSWGFFLSIPGPVTFARSRDLREVAQKAPLDRLLVETDAPHLTPAPCRGQQNEPAFVRLTAEEVARLRRISLEELGRETSRNVFQAFRMPDSVRSRLLRET